MIGLAKGQQILDKIKVQSKIGHGTLYLLNTGITFEVHGSGLFLELDNGEILYSSVSKKDSLVISWTEGVVTYDIKFSIKNATETVQKINQHKKTIS